LCRNKAAQAISLSNFSSTIRPKQVKVESVGQECPTHTVNAPRFPASQKDSRFLHFAVAGAPAPVGMTRFLIAGAPAPVGMTKLLLSLAFDE
jgi:hypothetical protein